MSKEAIDVKEKFIEDVERIFGHKINPSKLIDFIEGSPLSMKKAKENFGETFKRYTERLRKMGIEEKDLNEMDRLIDEVMKSLNNHKKEVKKVSS